MAYTISELKTELTGTLHGTTINKIQGLDNLINRAARKVLSDIDPIETVRISQLASPLYDKVYDYSCPTDLKGDRIVDIRPQINRITQDRFAQTYNEEFDLQKAYSFNEPKFTVQYDSAVKSLRITKNLITGILVNSASSVTGQGTWVIGDDATNLTTDTLQYVSGGGSLRFDVTGATTTAFLENTTMNPVDISRDLNQGSEFLYVWIPNSSAVTNFNLRWGSSSANYWSVTVTSTQDSTAFQNGWNLLRFDWNGATVVGSPVSTAVDYVRFTMTYNGDADTDFRLNNIVSQLGSIFEIEYYSKFIFRTSSGVFQETVTDDSNIVNLDTDSYNIFFNLVAYFVTQQLQGADGTFDAQYFKDLYDTDVARYVAKTKSQIIKPSQRYYSVPSFRKSTNRGNNIGGNGT